MSVIIFGNGPMPNEPGNAVMAPGSRTWQIVRTVAQGLAEAGSAAETITVFGLDEAVRASGTLPQPVTFSVPAGHRVFTVEYIPLAYDQFRALAESDPASAPLPSQIHAVVGTGSAQPYSTAARFAARKNLPVWIDIFGDPLSELQSQLEILPSDISREDLDNRLVHVWKLLLDGLMHGTQFSALSRRQVHAVQGQLGCAGRLDQYAAAEPLCHYLPYAVFEDDVQVVERAASSVDHFTLMWCGSFNTWMDVPTLTEGIVGALKANPHLRLLVVGGRIPGYNEISYDEFITGVRKAGVEGSVTLMDWQPLEAMHGLYAQCDLGLSIDRFTYEAELGSRTRLINFLAAGLPVASTVVTELSVDLAADGYLTPFQLGDASSLTAALLQASEEGSAVAARRGKACREYCFQKYNGRTWGTELRSWLKEPVVPSRKMKLADPNQTNQLSEHWRKVREPLGL